MSTQTDRQSMQAAALAALSAASHTVGAKQIRKALRAGTVQKVFLAKNADPALTAPIAALCAQQKIAVIWVRTMTELGHACGIEVGAAAAAIVA